MRAPRLDRPACEVRHVDLLARENQPAGLDLAREQDVVDEVRKPLGLVRDDGQEAAPQIVGAHVLRASVLGGAVTAAIGVRSSWETVAMKSVLSSSNRRSSVRSRNA